MDCHLIRKIRQSTSEKNQGQLQYKELKGSIGIYKNKGITHIIGDKLHKAISYKFFIYLHK